MSQVINMCHNNTCAEHCYHALQGMSFRCVIPQTVYEGLFSEKPNVMLGSETMSSSQRPWAGIPFSEEPVLSQDSDSMMWSLYHSHSAADTFRNLGALPTWDTLVFTVRIISIPVLWVAVVWKDEIKKGCPCMMMENFGFYWCPQRIWDFFQFPISFWASSLF